MKFCLVHPRAISISAKELAETLECERFNPYDTGRDNFTQYDLVFNYGGGYAIMAKKFINTPFAVRTCIDKVATLRILNKNKIPTVAYATRKEDIPKTWATIVVRAKVDGRKAEDLDFWYDHSNIPDAPLYTEHFDHNREYRVVVFMGKVVGRYYKKLVKGDWIFTVQPKTGFEQMDEACLKAAKALGIDYCGFDVVSKTKKDFAILEANSGATLTEEARLKIFDYFYNPEYF